MPRRSSPTASQMFLAALGEQMLTYRETNGLTLEELADRVGVKPDCIDDIEHGWLDPSLTLMWLVAEALNTTLLELLDIDGAELAIAAEAAA